MKKIVIFLVLSIVICTLLDSCKKKTCPAYSNGQQDDKPNLKKAKRKNARLF